jgi:UDP:flavonoid glycosyltransferase YjiC (YdhE family)
MRIAIVTVGSLGDVRPYAALGAGLRAAGHAVRLVTHERFRPLAADCGIAFSPLAGDPQDVLTSPEGQRWQHSGRNVVRFVRGFGKIIEPLMHQIIAACYEACRDAELIVASLLGFCASYHVAEKLNVQLLPAFYLPLSPTRSFPSVMFTATRSFGGALNLLTHRMAGLGLWEPLRPTFNRMRREVLDLPPMAFGQVQREIVGGRFPILYGYSPTLVPPAVGRRSPPRSGPRSPP